MRIPSKNVHTTAFKAPCELGCSSDRDVSYVAIVAMDSTTEQYERTNTASTKQSKVFTSVFQFASSFHSILKITNNV